jgi:riboflavin synthase alpha subunit
MRESGELAKRIAEAVQSVLMSTIDDNGELALDGELFGLTVQDVSEDDVEVSHTGRATFAIKLNDNRIFNISVLEA